MTDGTRVKIGRALPPSARRIDVSAFATTSAAWSAITFTVGLIALWRPLGDWPAPHGDLAEHASRWVACVLQDVFPSALNRMANGYKAYLEGLGPIETKALFGRLWMAAGACLAPISASAWLHLRPRDGLLFMRGSKRFSGREAIKRLRKTLATRVSARPDHPLAPSVPYPSDLWTRHVLLVAGTGAGKSTCLKPLISSIIRADESLLLYDPKGDFTKAFKEPILLAPWDIRSWAWDIAADIKNIGAARRFAAALIKEGQDPMWANSARQVMVGAIMMLRAEQGDKWGWRELADTLSLPQDKLLSIMRFYHPEAIRAVERASVTTQGVLINLSAFCAAIHDLAEAWGDAPPERRVSFVDWLTKPRRFPRQIILQGNGSYPEITRGYVEGIFSVIGGLVNSVEIDDNPGRKAWIILDELPQCGKIPILPIFSVGRSRGIRCVAACQDLSQLEEIHGREATRSLVSMTGSIIIGQMSQGDTAEALAKALGSREVERRNESHCYGRDGSQSVSYAREDLALYKPSELGSRLGLHPRRQGVVMALALEGNAYELFWPFAKFPEKRKAHIPSRWALGERSRAVLEQHRVENDFDSQEFGKPEALSKFEVEGVVASGSDVFAWTDLEPASEAQDTGAAHANSGTVKPVASAGPETEWLSEAELMEMAWPVDASGADDVHCDSDAALAT
jgi:hypothetical protein